MKSLFEFQTKEEILLRLQQLSPDCEPLWGSMNVAQMMAHCTGGLNLAMGHIKPKRQILGILFGWLFKSSYSNKYNFPKNVKTIKGGEIIHACDFDTEYIRLMKTIEAFYLGGEPVCTTHPHPIMGKFTPKQWGIGMYKHLDHHLRQFGV